MRVPLRLRCLSFVRPENSATGGMHETLVFDRFRVSSFVKNCRACKGNDAALLLLKSRSEFTGSLSENWSLDSFESVSFCRRGAGKPLLAMS